MALEMNPKSVPCSLQLASALVLVHEYDEAVSFYETSIANQDYTSLPLIANYAVLLRDLERFSEAEFIANQGLAILASTCR